MIFDRSDKKSREKAKKYIIKLFQKEKGKVKIEEFNPSISDKQRGALHLFFCMISQELNNRSIEIKFNFLSDSGDYSINDIFGKPISMTHTPIWVKESLWRPIQQALFGVYSTNDIDTYAINTILDILINHFGNMGIPLAFPNKIDYYKKLLNDEKVMKQYEKDMQLFNK